jgi:hypothetical protein
VAGNDLRSAVRPLVSIIEGFESIGSSVNVEVFGDRVVRGL